MNYPNINKAFVYPVGSRREKRFEENFKTREKCEINAKLHVEVLN